MKRVTIVNLAGTAYHLESDGAELLDAWFDEARARLAADPDRDELLADFERAVADRCQAIVTHDRSVVPTDQARAIVASLGTVHPADGHEDAHADPAPSTAAGTTGARPDDDPWRERRLYRLTGDDDMLAGVCAGIAAYMRLDVTIVRLVFVLLFFLTSGFMLVLYIAMAVFTPEADTPAKRAAARGHGETAQEMIGRARDGAGPAMESAGTVLRQIGRGLASLLRWIFLSIAWIVTVLAAVQITWLYINGGGITSAFDAGTDRWIIALWVISIAWIVVGFSLALAGGFGLVDGRPQRPRSRGTEVAATTMWSAAMIAAFIAVPLLPATHSAQIKGITDGHQRIEMYGRTVCFDDRSSKASDNDRCRNNDVIIRWGEFSDERYDD
ncbi:MAG: PspC domain-containing protein [Gaiellales bacterium]